MPPKKLSLGDQSESKKPETVFVSVTADSINKPEKKEKKEKKPKKEPKEKKEKKENLKEKKTTSKPTTERKRKETSDESEKTKKKKKSNSTSTSVAPSLNVGSSSSSSLEDEEMRDSAISKEDLINSVFTCIPTSVHVELSCLNNKIAQIDDGFVVFDEIPTVKGIKLVEALQPSVEWGDVLTNPKAFLKFASALYVSISADDSLTVREFTSSIEEVLNLNEPCMDLKGNASLIKDNFAFKYDFLTHSIIVTFNRSDDVEELAEILYEFETAHELEEAEEMEEEIEEECDENSNDTPQATNDIQVTFEFTFENESNRTTLELFVPKSNSYKAAICADLHIDEKDLTNYGESITEKLVKATGVLATTLKDIISNRVDVKVVHRHVYYEQRVISYELFDRMKDIIGNEFSSYNHLCFLVCTPDQNTLWHQTMERLERSNILPPNTEAKTVSIKYREDHIQHFEKFRDRIASEKDTLFIVIADECHFAITKEGAHDKIVNDELALQHNNFFVLLVSATPYNVLSVDSNIPEMYKLFKPYEDLEVGTKIQVVSTKYDNSGMGVLLQFNQDSEIVYEFVDSNNQANLQEVKEITGKIPVLMNDGEGFNIRELVDYEQILDSASKAKSKKTKTIKYKVKSLERPFEMIVDLSNRDLKKIQPSTTKRITAQAIGNIPKDKFVEIFDKIHWYVTFKRANDPASQYYTVNDWEFKKLTNYEEYNVVSWSEVQKRTTLERTEHDTQTKRYFSKQDYINSLDQEEKLIFKDSKFEKLLASIKFASNLRPIMLAIDYHFWIIKQGLRLNLFDETKAYELFESIKNTPDISLKHKNYVTFCLLVYIIHHLDGDVLENPDFMEEIDEEEDILSKTKSSKKSKEEEIEKKIASKLEYLQENKPNDPIRLFKIPPNELKKFQDPHTEKLINNLLESGNISNDDNNSNNLNGRMKILRITITDIASTVFKLLKASMVNITTNTHVLPDILIDTGKNPLTLDQLSLISRTNLSEKILSTEDLKIYKKNPSRLSKKKKSLEYINLKNIPCILILVAKGRQGDTFPNSFDCMDMRAKGDSLPNYSSFTQEFGRLCRYVDDNDEKPIALVTDRIFKDLKKCGTGGASSIGNTSMNLDAYVTKMKQTTKKQTMTGQKYWTIVTLCRRLMIAADSKTIKKKKTKASYDYLRSGVNKDISTKNSHKNRLLLFAEPQIGKTDSFFHFLERVIMEIKSNSSERLENVNVDEPFDSDDVAVEAKVFSDIEKILPYHQYLSSQKIPEYASISEGKYAKLVLKTRSEVFAEFPQEKIKSVHKLSRIESFLTSSNYYWSQFIQKLSSHNFDLSTFQTFDGRYKSILNPKLGLQIVQCNPKETSNKPSEERRIEKIDLTDKVNIGLANMTREIRTIEKGEVYTLEIGSLENCFPGEKPHIFIPDSKKKWFKFDENCCVTQFLSPESSGVRSWIFMPSWNRSASGLFGLKSMKTTYRQIIVVRHSEFKCYRNTLDGKFVILSLPDIVDMQKLSQHFNIPTSTRMSEYSADVDKCKIIDYQLKDDVGGIGFSRLCIQIIANTLDLEFIWMMDDNCHHFDKVENGKKVPCSVSDVLLPLERIVYNEKQLISTVTPKIDKPEFKNRNNNGIIKLDDRIDCFTPGKDKIAIIGVRKDGYRYSESKNYKPFVRSFTVCSLFLLNTKSTIASGCLFPARTYLEDIEFEYACWEADLYCIKAQYYFLNKPANPLRIEYIPPPAVSLFETTKEIFMNITNEITTGTLEINNDESKEFKEIKDYIQANLQPHEEILNNFNNMKQTMNVFLQKEVVFAFLKPIDIKEQIATIKVALPCLEMMSGTCSFLSPNNDPRLTGEFILKLCKESKSTQSE